MLIATGSAVYRASTPAAGAPDEPLFRGEGVRCIAAGDASAFVALEDGEVRRIADGGDATVCSSVGEPIESMLILREEPEELLIGTVGAHLLRVADGEAERVGSFDALECRDEWHTPWGGPPAVRSLAATPDGWVYADIHVGSIMRSRDGGRTWSPVTPELNEDVHQVAACRSAPDRVYANTAKGVYVSDDRGETWAHRADDLDCRYGRAIAVAPDRPDLLLATVSDGPHGDNVHGQLWRSVDCGRTWRHVCDGFPDSTRENINTHHVAFARDGTAYALADGILHVGRQRARRWEPVWDAPDDPLMLASAVTSKRRAPAPGCE